MNGRHIDVRVLTVGCESESPSPEGDASEGEDGTPAPRGCREAAHGRSRSSTPAASAPAAGLIPGGMGGGGGGGGGW